MKGVRRKCVHRKIDILIDGDDANVRFRHVGVDLHFGEIVRNHENNRRLQTGRYGLANIDTARDHDAINRRRDGAMIEVRFRFIERALFDFHVGFGLMQVRHRLIEILLG